MSPQPSENPTDKIGPSVLVVVVAYEAGDHLQRCVDALDRQTYQNWRAIIWDNASSDQSVDNLIFSGKFEVINCPDNIGFAAANNRASLFSDSKYIATLNPDAFPEPSWLVSLITTAEKFGAAAVASLQLDDSDPDSLDGAGDCMSVAGIAWRGGYRRLRETAPTETCGVFSPCAAAALYRRDAFEGAHGFDERFFCYYEDVDLGFRLRLAGGMCLLEPAAVVRHVGSASSQKVSGFAEYHGFRNRIWTFMRNMPTSLLPIAIPAHVLITAYILLRSPKLLTVRLKALRDAWTGRKPFLRGRRQGLGFDGNVFRALVWCPAALSSRRPKTWRVDGP